MLEWRSIWLVSLFAVLVGAGKCYIPREFRAKKYLMWIDGQGAAIQVEFSQDTIFTHTGGGTVSTEACEDSEQNGRRTYLMTQTYCYELVILDTEDGLLFKQEDRYSDDVTQCQAVTGNSLENRILPAVDRLRAATKCPFQNGKYQATFINQKGVRDCIGDMQSHVTIQDKQMTFHICTAAFRETITRPRLHAFMCGGSIDGNFVDQDSNGRVLMLHKDCGAWPGCLLYCARYTVSGEVIDISIVVYPYPNDDSKQSICFNRFSSSTANSKTYALRLTDLTDRPQVTRPKTTPNPKRKTKVPSKWPVPPYMLFALIPAVILLVVVGIACSRFNRKRNATQEMEGYGYEDYEGYEGYEDYNYNMSSANQQAADRQGLLKAGERARNMLPPSEPSNRNRHNKNPSIDDEIVTNHRHQRSVKSMATDRRHDSGLTNHSAQRMRPVKRLARANCVTSPREHGIMTSSGGVTKKKASPTTITTPLLKTSRLL